MLDVGAEAWEGEWVLWLAEDSLSDTRNDPSNSAKR